MSAIVYETHAARPFFRRPRALIHADKTTYNKPDSNPSGMPL
ncbi:hypothetical protein [Neisseria sicca]|nr:hypothetical protein [Neisseria sicca]